MGHSKESKISRARSLPWRLLTNLTLKVTHLTCRSKSFTGHESMPMSSSWCFRTSQIGCRYVTQEKDNMIPHHSASRISGILAALWWYSCDVPPAAGLDLLQAAGQREARWSDCGRLFDGLFEAPYPTKLFRWPWWWLLALKDGGSRFSLPANHHEWLWHAMPMAMWPPTCYLMIWFASPHNSLDRAWILCRFLANENAIPLTLGCWSHH